MARRSLVLSIGSAVLLGALSTSAQTLAPPSRPERPYRGVYASGTDNAKQVLTANGAVSTGYDTSATTAAAEAGIPGAVVNPVDPQGSLYNNFSGGLSYSAKLEKFSAGASLNASARQYPQLAISTSTSQALSSGVSASLARNTKLTGGASITHQSTRGFVPFPALGDPELGQVVAPNADYGTGRTDYFTYSGNLGLAQQISRKTSLTVSYDRHIDQRDNGFEDLMQQTGSFRFTRTLSKYLSLRLGYGYTEARYGVAANNYLNHNLDTGIDYSRDLSLTRRTKLAFTTGAAVVRQASASRYDVTGSARLTREIGRSWNAALIYQRQVGYDEWVREPMFSDSINSGITGLITRRLSFQAGIGATRGTVGVVSRPANGFGAWTGSAALNTGLTRHLGLGVNYTFYRYDFDQGAALTTGLLPQTNRHSINVTLNAWAPIFQHGKRPNASR